MGTEDLILMSYIGSISDNEREFIVETYREAHQVQLFEIVNQLVNRHVDNRMVMDNLPNAEVQHI